MLENDEDLELKMVPDDVMEKAMTLIIEGCKLLDMPLKTLLNADNREQVVGFIVADRAVFAHKVRVIDESGIWEMSKEPRSLN